MTPDELQALRRQTVTTVARAGSLLSIGRTLSYQLAREGELAEGVRVLRVGRKLVVPVRPLLVALGYEEDE